ncbi:MAG: NifU family protein [Chitinophagales bacterium]|nr:NifU family protein [Chitinophagales bacterium]
METKVIPIMIYTEATPNPQTLKFVLNCPLLPNDFVDLESIEEAEKSPFAKMLFGFEGVTGVFISNNFVTITKSNQQIWQEMIIPFKNAIKDFLQSGQSVLEEDFKKPLRQKTNDILDSDGDVEAKIKGVLEKYVKPGVEMDGGSITFSSFHDGRLTVQLRGSCNGCPSSMVTLKQGIEGLMKRFVPEVHEVVAE